MSYLYMHQDVFNGYLVQSLNIMQIIAFVSGILTIITKNPVVSVLFLISLFASISIYLVLIGMVFIGISYLLVYVGAVSILFLFILMLINIRVSELVNDTNNTIPLGVISTIILFIPLSNTLPYNEIESEELSNGFIKKELPYVSSNNWDGNIADISDIASIGNVMYTSYSLWLIVTSVILLLSMVGSIVITIKQKY